MVVPTIQHAFSAGEWSPELFGRSDTERYKRAASTMRNMWPSYRGGAYSRAGTRFIGRCKQAPSSPNAPRLIPFQFSVTQGYALEFGDNYMRPIFAGGYVTEPAIAITGASQADPCVISVSGTPFANGDWVGISGVSGMTQLNGQTYIVAGVASGSFTLIDPFTDAALDATGFSAYVAGGAAARLFTLVTPYAAADLEFLKFTQSADVMSLTHPDYPPFDLARIANDDWTLIQTDFSATIAAPTGATAATSSAGAVQYQYVVTAVDATTGSESVASNIATVNSVDISTTAGTITVSWTAVAAVSSYNVYLAPTVIGGGAVPVGSQFGFIGRAFGTQFADTNITPDFTKAPPNHQDPFAISTVIGVTLTGTRTGADTTTTVTVASSGGTGFRGIPIVVGGSVTGVIVEDGGANYTDGDPLVFGGAGSGGSGVVIVGPADGTFPGTVAYFQQRRWYAATLNQPDTYFASKPDDFTNFDTSTPTVDDDAIIGTPWAQQINGIQFMLAMPFGLVMFTGNGSWQLSGGDQATPVTPARQIAVPQAAVGCSPIVPPIPINNEILFVQSKSSVVRDLVYNFWMNIYSGTDITVEAAHLFENRQILEWAWAEEPNKLLWAVRDDGILLCLTWLKEQETHAWSRHDTQGLFKSLCVTSESTSQPASGVPPSVPAQGGASHAAGTTELDIAGVYTGAADSPFVTISVWFKPSASPVDGTDVAIGGHTNADLLYGDPGDRTGQYLFPVVDATDAFEIIPQFNVGSQTAFAASWHNLLWSIDTNHADGLKIVQAYVDDVQQTIQPYTDGHPAFDISFADPAGIIAFLGGLSGIGYTGDIYSVWFAPGVFLDLTVTGNRRKFISGSGQVVDLGANGQLPTGTAPAFYFKGNHTQFPTNLGTGGSVTNSGAALTDAATNPPGV